MTVWAVLADASRTGVPITLARLLRWARATHDIAVHVVAGRGGPLVPVLSQVAASVTVLEPAGRRSLADAAGLALASAGRPGAGESVRGAAWRQHLRDLPAPEVVLAHGAGALPVAEAVAGPSTPLVVHLHELELGLRRSLPAARLRAALGRARRVLVVSDPVADAAVTAGARPERLAVVPGTVDADGPFPAGPARSALARLTGTGAQREDRWVLGAGAPGWRKGTDRMTALAHALGRSPAPARVGWVGGRPGGTEALAVDAEDPVTWFPARADPWALLAGSDVVVVPSREDPLPLVALEAGQHALPVVATASGGLTALLAGGRGVTVAPADLRGLRDAVTSLLADRQRAADLGAALAAHVQAHHRAGVVGPTWWEAMTGAARAG